MLTYLSGCRKVHLANSYDQENSGRMGETDSLEDWILVVKHVTARDSGSYECQVDYMQFISLLVIKVMSSQTDLTSPIFFSHRLPLIVETSNRIALN